MKKNILILLVCIILLTFASCDTEPDVREPVINSAGANKTELELADDETSATLTVNANSADGKPATYHWSVKSAPQGASPVIVDQTDASTNVTGLTIAGTYVFEIEVTGNNNITKTAEVTITVKADVRAPIITSVAADAVALQLPNETSATLNVVAVSADGSAATYSWSVKSAPQGAEPVFANATAASTGVSGLTVTGAYEFEVEVTGSNGIKKTSSVVAINVAADNRVPVIDSVGANKNTLQLPSETAVTLNGAFNGANGLTVASYEWTVVAPPALPGGAVITNTGGLAANVTGLNAAGAYKFQLKVTGSNGAITTVNETVTITVNADNRLPTANAGANQAIRLPVNMVALSGSGTDPDDGDLSYKWSYVSGPATYTISNPNIHNPNITNLTTAGTYVFQLEVTGSNGNKHTSNVSIVVRDMMVVNPGTTQNTNLQAGGRQITLNGSASTAPGGSIANYEWTCTNFVPVGGVSADGVVSGLNSNNGAISSSASASANVTLKKAGTYTFALKITDNEGNVSGTQTVTVNVGAMVINRTVNVAPVPFTTNTQTLMFKLEDADNYSIEGGADAYFGAADLAGITYAFTSANPPVDLSLFNNGNIPRNESGYARDEMPTITQTFYNEEEEIGSRKVVVEVGLTGFPRLYKYVPFEYEGEWYDTDGTTINAVPDTQLNLTKDINEVN